MLTGINSGIRRRLPDTIVVSDETKESDCTADRLYQSICL